MRDLNLAFQDLFAGLMLESIFAAHPTRQFLYAERFQVKPYQ